MSSTIPARLFTAGKGVTSRATICSIATMFEVIFFVFVVLGIVLIDSRLRKLIKIQRESLTELRECETHLQMMREAYKAQGT
jgi:hypothetical protein